MIKTTKGFDTVDAGGKVLKKYTHPNEIDIQALEDRGLPVVLLIDADIVAYRASASCDGRVYLVKDSVTLESEEFKYKKDAVAYCKEQEISEKLIKLKFIPEPVTHATSNVTKAINKLRRVFDDKGLGAIRLECYLTPKANFRNTVKSDYKANRKDVRRPTHLGACKEFLTDKFKAETIEGYEADDLLCIRAKQLIAFGCSPVICTLDKDLDQASCFHYNWVKSLLYFTTEQEGLVFLYKQLLTGDRVDNIPGIPGVGPKTADKILAGLEEATELELYSVVLGAYLEKIPRDKVATGEPNGEGYIVIKNETDEEFAKRIISMTTQNMRLLYLCREFGELWEPPVKEPEKPVTFGDALTDQEIFEFEL